MMQTTTSTATPSPLDYLQFGECLGHHGTVPRDAQPGEPFVQLLKIRSRAGQPAREPSILLWCYDPPFGSVAMYFVTERLREASQVLERCQEFTLPDVKNYLLSDDFVLGQADSFSLYMKNSLGELVLR